MKPVVLIAPEDVTDAVGDVYMMNKEYAACLREAGAIPLGAGDFRAVCDYAEMADALLLPGGPDIHPARYGQYAQDFREVMTVSVPRDDFDFALCNAFLSAKKPVFGIGRGMQVINTALGGTLVRNLRPRLLQGQHLTGDFSGGYAVLSETPGSFCHMEGVHPVTTEKNSLLSRTLGQRFTVNSFHHQAVDRPGEGLRITARSDDDAAEAIEHESLPVFGVQWHPEHACDGYERDVSLFRAFVSMIKGGAR